uniref:Uncharacterized protein n=1 Tax=viral metagenome TaxID=1070528 RepID=A0A6C0EJH9_9ZZZZ
MRTFIFVCIVVCIILYKSINFIGETYINYTDLNDKDPEYVFWTGGYDSTFRICELLIIYKRPVQPVYISYNLDSAKKSDKWVRKNRREEIDAMEKIRHKLYTRFPYTKGLLHKTIDINNNIDYPEYDINFNNLKLWPKKRRVHQYEHLGKIAYLLKTPVDCGVIGIHQNSNFVTFLKNNLIKTENNYILDVLSTHPLHYIRFPLFNRTKRDLCDISKKNKFNDIIKISWSCWFPNNKKPCNKCPMCIERFNCE